MSSPSPACEQALSFFEQNRKQSLDDLCSLVRIPSVSFDGFAKEEVERSAQKTAELLFSRGFEHVEILQLPGVHPYVYADYLHAPGKPTLLLYAHHDVQPAGEVSAWNTPPFEPVERDGRLYGRGTADDKAGIILHSSALSSYLSAGQSLPVNLKVLIEGEEEAGSTHLSEFIDRHLSRLKSDVMVLTDTGNFDVGLPSITTSLRGLCVVEIEVSSLRQSVHSGSLGGPLPDAGLAMAKILASLTDDSGRIAIPGLYDKVRPLTTAEQESLACLPFTSESFCSQAGVLEGVPLVSACDNPWAMIWRQPSVSVNAVEISSRREARNIINGSAWARVGIRLVPDMDAQETEAALIAHIRKVAPFGVKVAVTSLGAKGPWSTSTEHPAFLAALSALEAGYGQKPTQIGCGGSIGFVGPLSEKLGGIPALLIGVEDPYTNAHSENESVCIADLFSGIRSEIHLFDKLSRL
ncbi:MAG TPA: M20/M25/M40 family metallo-hydrolase [Pseudomonadota bacterium]|jgi:acetylornithine deacetylase/succinyl-diaminopimelate desuccinylase-like protein|nr:M20/M25/M40 family metallo-hydrolase [Pseudomonadota bacterium]